MFILNIRKITNFHNCINNLIGLVTQPNIQFKHALHTYWYVTQWGYGNRVIVLRFAGGASRRTTHTLGSSHGHLYYVFYIQFVAVIMYATRRLRTHRYTYTTFIFIPTIQQTCCCLINLKRPRRRSKVVASR